MPTETTAHTPEPWKLELIRWSDKAPIAGFAISVDGKKPWLCAAGAGERYNHCTVVADEHIAQGITTGFSAAECEANARLIASAPDMLARIAELEAALKLIEIINDESASDCRKRMGTRRGNSLVAARAALKPGTP